MNRESVFLSIIYIHVLLRQLFTPVYDLIIYIPFLLRLYLHLPPQHETFCLTRLLTLIIIMQKEKETFNKLNTIATDVRNNKLTRKDLIFRKCFPDRISGKGSEYDKKRE